MKDQENIHTNPNQEIDLYEIFAFFWKNKFLLLFSSIFVGFIVTLYSYSLENIYQSESVLSPSFNQTSLPDAGISELAAFAGLSMNNDEVSDVDKAIEIIKSLDFFEKFVTKHDLLFSLIAVEGWNEKDNSFDINNKIYNMREDKWLSNEKYSINGVPSFQKSHKIFLRRFTIEKNRLNGTVIVRMNHYSPHEAKKWLEKIIKEINETTRVSDREEAQNSIDYLTREMRKTSNMGVQDSISRLIEEQMKTIMLVNASPEYLFKVLSPPYAPELKNYPRRSIFLIVSLLIGFILGCLYLVFKKILKK